LTRSVLIVAPFLPWPVDFGGAARVFHLTRELARVHEVMLIAPARDDEFDALLALGAICDVTAVPARGTAREPAGARKRLLQARSLAGRRSFQELFARSDAFQAALEQLFRTRRIDLVQYEFPQMARYRPPRPRPTVCDAHNVEHELLRRVAATTPSLFQRVFNLAESQKVRLSERAAWQRSTACVTTSERDAAVVRAATDTPVVVVPNGVDVASFTTGHRAPHRHHAIFTGAMRHAPNADGAHWYVTQVQPLVARALPGASLAIVGADPPPSVSALRADDVQVTGRVDDVRPYLAQASVAVVPLRAGSGTRLKILEAFAAGVPVVSTSLGAEGLDVQHETQLLLADDAAAFAAAVTRLMRDRSLAEKLAANARALAAGYDWARIAPRLVAAHDLAIERFNSASRATLNL
jgi:glycosyltransferase involved in cell wall biosynthesis